MPERLPSVTCYNDCDIVHAAYAVTGLIELANRREIDLSFALSPHIRPRPRGPFTLWLEITFPGATEPLNVCCDFHDRSSYTCPSSLAACDVYFKSNYSEKTLDAVDYEDRHKILPFGPYTPCRPERDRALVRRQTGNSLAHLRHRLSFPRRRTLREQIHDFGSQLLRYRRYLSRLPWAEYENPPATELAPTETLVFFNPTCWAEKDDETRGINRLRAESIVLMRKLLGSRFAGGFRRSPLAEKLYPEALEDRHYSHHEYLEYLKKAPIALYTNGLVGCFSWRLIEVFAASKCIVSERIQNDAGYPLDEHSGIIQCDTPEALAAAVDALQRDPQRILDMQRRAWATYQDKMRPAKAVEHMLGQLAEALEAERAEAAANQPAGAAALAGAADGAGRIPVLSGAVSLARQWVAFAGRQKQWLVCMALFVLIWTTELFLVQKSTLVYPNDTSAKFAFWAPKIRLALDFLFISTLSIWLRPWLLFPLVIGSFFAYLGLITYHSYFVRPLSFLTIVSTWREGLQLSEFALNLFPLRAAVVLGLAMLLKLALLSFSGKATPPRVRLSGALLATAFAALYLVANFLDPLKAIQTTRGVGRLGEIRGYLGPWFAEWYYLRDPDLLLGALSRRQISYDRLTPVEAEIPIEKHLVIVQCESLDYNILGYRAEGQEVTPFLNRLRDLAMFYRVRAIHSNGSADADFVALNGVSGSTHANTYTIPDYPYENTTPQLLAKCGYSTVGLHGNSGDFYNRRPPWQKMGFKELYFREEMENRLGLKGDRWGIPDKEVFSASAQKLRTATTPTCHFIITLTTHIPYRQLTNEEMEIYKHPHTTVQNYINNMRYLDNCIRDYITSLGSGATVLLYADHPTEGGDSEFLPDRQGAREYIPCFIYDTDHDLAKLQKTRNEPLSKDGSLNLVDVINYLRAQIARNCAPPAAAEKAP